MTNGEVEDVEKEEAGGEGEEKAGSYSSSLDQLISSTTRLDGDNEDKSTTEGKKKRKRNKKKTKQQTDPPTIAIKKLFPNAKYPHGQEVEHPAVGKNELVKVSSSTHHFISLYH